MSQTWSPEVVLHSGPSCSTKSHLWSTVLLSLHFLPHTDTVRKIPVQLRKGLWLPHIQVESAAVQSLEATNTEGGWGAPAALCVAQSSHRAVWQGQQHKVDHAAEVGMFNPTAGCGDTGLASHTDVLNHIHPEQLQSTPGKASLQQAIRCPPAAGSYFLGC